MCVCILDDVEREVGFPLQVGLFFRLSLKGKIWRISPEMIRRVNIQTYLDTHHLHFARTLGFRKY